MSSQKTKSSSRTKSKTLKVKPGKYVIRSKNIKLGMNKASSSRATVHVMADKGDWVVVKGQQKRAVSGRYVKKEEAIKKAAQTVAKDFMPKFKKTTSTSTTTTTTTTEPKIVVHRRDGSIDKYLDEDDIKELENL